jgi:hypothetical protein
VVIDNMQTDINNTYVQCNQWCCGCTLPNGSYNCFCTDTYYNQESDECVYTLSGERENWSDKICPFKITQVLNGD